MKKVIVKGHQRSGNNYLMSLLSINFFNCCEISEFSDNNDHCILYKLNQEKKYIYIYRNKDNVLKSLFRERKLYGICENDYENFIKTQYNLMYEPELSVDIDYICIDKEKTFYDICNSFFGCIEKTPEQWYDYHLQKYKELSDVNSNLLLVSYDELICNFNSEMNKISIYLTGETKETYQNVQTKVGWYNKNEEIITN